MPDEPPMDRDRRQHASRELGALGATDEERRRRRDPRRRKLRVLAGLDRTLHRLRRERGFSQSGLARRAGVTRAMISAYENGHSQPSLATLDRLLAALEVTPSELAAALEAVPARPKRKDRR